MNNLNLPIIGLGALTDEYAKLPLQWMPHIQVADVDTSVERALHLGGSELMDAKDDDGRRLWSVLIDPNGAAFGLIPVVPQDQVPDITYDSATAARAVGRISWINLTVANASLSRDFYSRVIEWSAEPIDMQDGDESYTDFKMLGISEIPTAGISHARGPNADMPPVWILHLPVGDLDESIRRVKEEGGTVLKTLGDSTGQCTYAAIKDPVGAYFAIVTA